jgi:hypothetical protein
MLVQREAAIGYRMMRKEAGGLAEPCGSAPAMSDSGGGWWQRTAETACSRGLASVNSQGNFISAFQIGSDGCPPF